MRTVSVDKLFDDRKSDSYSHDLFWIVLWIIISFSSRIWGDLLYKILDITIGRPRTVEQLIAMSLVMILIIFLFVRNYDVDV